MADNEELLKRREAVTPRGIPRATTATVESASGALLRDHEGRELIDFTGGIGVMNAGHCQQAVVDAIHQQAKKLLHIGIHVATYEPYIALCEKLVRLLPHGPQTKAMLVNSGAEAVENAVKIARQATQRDAVICFTDGFHGRTLMGMSLTSKVGYKAGCGPFAPEVYRLPFPNYYRHGDGLDEDAFGNRELVRLKQAFSNVVSPQDVAAMVIELVQGEGGFNPVPRAYLEKLRQLCDEHGIMLIFDEVQTGFCRTGHWGAFQHYEVTPDLSTWAKSMSGGLPIGAVVGKTHVMDAAQPGTIGGTFGGNPVACAAALATIKIMEELDLNKRAQQIGSRVRERFLTLKQKCELVSDVRGLGAMIGVELVLDGDPTKPATGLVKQIIAECVSNGLILIVAGTYGNVIRVLSPLVITDDQLDRGLDIIEYQVLRHAPTPSRVG